jgi:hypothetical protein
MNSMKHFPGSREKEVTLIHHQGIICGVVFARSSLRRIATYASVVTERSPSHGRKLSGWRCTAFQMLSW